MTSSSNNRVEVITSTEKRRRWSAHEKRTIVEETYQPGMSVSYIARKHGISPSQVFYWRRHMESGALAGLDFEEELFPKRKVKDLVNRVRELERLLGKKTLEIEILREAVHVAREKKLISRQPLPSLEDLE
jgi:transposase